MTGLLTCTAALSLCAHSHGTADSKHQATLAATTSDSIPGMEAPFKGHFTNSEHGFNLYIDYTKQASLHRDSASSERCTGT